LRKGKSAYPKNCYFFFLSATCHPAQTSGPCDKAGLLTAAEITKEGAEENTYHELKKFLNLKVYF
jgi:hypothetical protein